jgi:acyl-CoA reductase-like NAD-dependent aldehyde dehydrogenase
VKTNEVVSSKNNRNFFADINKQFINGEWVEGSTDRKKSITNPFDGSILEEVVLADKSDIDLAYEAAKEAQKNWRHLPDEEKIQVFENAIKIIEENKDELIDIIIKDTGGSFLKANLEINTIIGVLKEAGSYPEKLNEKQISNAPIPGKENRIHLDPVGVVSIITPFNVPLILGIHSLVPALATGNAVVLKPDFQVGLSGGGIIARIFEKAGLPKGVLNIILTEIDEIGDYFIEHPIPEVICFTGSSEVGKHVAVTAGKHLKRVVLELGGNSPFVVLEDADINQAVDASIVGKFVHQGQICMAINRFIIHQNVYDEFVEKFINRAKSLTYGNPLDPKIVLGPIINQKQITKINKLIERAKNEGATLALEGKQEGNMITPYVFTNVTNDMEVAQSEIFGPVALMIPFKDEQEAIDIANDTIHGLSAAVFTSDVEKGYELAKQFESGMAHVNDQPINDVPGVPFGGEKNSGVGRLGGRWSIESFTTPKWISVQKEKRKYPF